MISSPRRSEAPGSLAHTAASFEGRALGEGKAEREGAAKTDLTLDGDGPLELFHHLL